MIASTLEENSMLKKSLLLTIVLLSIWWTMVIAGVFCFYNQGGWGWLGCILVLSVFICLLWLVLPRNFRYLLFALIIFPLAIPGFWELESQILYGTSLSYSSVLAILNTYSREIYDFVGNFGIKCWLPLLWLLFCLLSLLWVKIDLGLDWRKKSVLLCLSVAIVFFAGFGVAELSLKFSSLYQAAADWADFRKRSANVQAYAFDGIADLNKDNGKRLYVVVIGESAWRGVMSVYGYPKATTPFFDRIRNSLYVFNDVVSNASVTNVMLDKFLNFQDGEPYAGNLIDFFKSAGFKTYWLSAHARYGLFDRYAHLLNHVDEITYINENRTLWTESVSSEWSLDNELLPAFEAALEDKADKKVVFVHLMGSHGHDYRNRFFAGYEDENPIFIKHNEEVSKYITYEHLRSKYLIKFSDYTKSVHFTDSQVLKPLFDKVWAQKEVSSYVLYLSDHAEQVSGNPEDKACFCHAQDVKQMHEIPFVLWLSEKYKRENAAYVKDFASYVNRPYESGDLIYSILDLSRLSHEKIDVTKSVFNQNFRLRKRAYDSMR